MANSTPLILHVTPKILDVMPVTRECAPVREWDNAARVFTDTQVRDDNGLPVWETEALLPVGWGRTTTPVRLRIAAAKKPAVKPDPLKLMEVLTGATPAASAAPAAAPAPTAQTLKRNV